MGSSQLTKTSKYKQARYINKFQVLGETFLQILHVIGQLRTLGAKFHSHNLHNIVSSVTARKSVHFIEC